jgi:exosome complex component RRP4
LSNLVRGHGTYVNEEKTLRASVAGVLEKVNKLISIRPLKARYNGEIGDLIVGRITEVQQKRWKVDVNSKLDAVLLLYSVNLPGGELVNICNFYFSIIYIKLSLFYSIKIC